MIKLTNILKEIKIRSANNNNPHTSNEGLCDFLNHNIKDLIKKEDISDNRNNGVHWIVDDINSLELDIAVDGLYKNDEEEYDGSIIEYNKEIGIAYHWLCPEEDLPDYGSFEWEEMELAGVKFWKVEYNI